jgi:hypothetical protein
MTTTFHIEPAELNEDFLQKIKSLFGEKKLLISVEEDEDETAYLLSTISNRRKFAKSLSELEKGELVTQTLEQLRK